jgi:hypothetical protein
MENTSVLMWGVLFGSIGLGFFVYGKKQKAMVPMICGIGLMALPYLIPNVYTLVSVSVVLILLPFSNKI